MRPTGDGFTHVVTMDTLYFASGPVPAGPPEGEPMQTMTRSAIGSDEPAAEAAPGPLPKPPSRPPAEPIVIRTPPRPRAGPEIDGSNDEDEEDGGEIRRPPGWVPDLPPPPRPEERAARPSAAPERLMARRLARSAA